MRLAGTIVEWNDERGFGFAVPHAGGERAFVHVKAFEPRGGRPFEGARVSWEPRRDARGRLQATAVRFVADPHLRTVRRSGSRTWRAVAGIAALAAIAALWVEHRLPDGVAGAYGLASVAGLAVYGMDKSAAQRGRWRTPESTLHLVALFGGWPGALVAQDLFRHKSSKTAFQIVFWFTCLVNVAVVACALSGKLPREWAMDVW
jgi:uncharacterized membrane protein YsdA (DUF1294 family)/cold shock CspA family protein